MESKPKDDEPSQRVAFAARRYRGDGSGGRAFRSTGHPEEFFGPFSVGKLGDEAIEAEMSVSWPNLAISMRNTKRALGESAVEDG